MNADNDADGLLLLVIVRVEIGDRNPCDGCFIGDDGGVSYMLCRVVGGVGSLGTADIVTAGIIGTVAVGTAEIGTVDIGSTIDSEGSAVVLSSFITAGVGDTLVSPRASTYNLYNELLRTSLNNLEIKTKNWGHTSRSLGSFSKLNTIDK